MVSGPTQRTLDRMRKMGFIADVVERWIPYARGPEEEGERSGPGGIRRDAFHFGDVLCARENEGVILVQTTTRSNMSSRRTKILGNDDARRWLASGGRILLHGWHHKKKGAPWKVNEEEIGPADFDSSSCEEMPF